MEDTSPVKESFRKRAYLQLTPLARVKKGISATNWVICVMIICSAAIAILETEPMIVARVGSLFVYLEWIFTAFFFVEYVTRLWVQAESPRFGDGWAGKMRYARTPAALLDLLAMAPILMPVGGSEAFLLRLFRLLRVLRMARLGRLSDAIRYVAEAMSSRSYELFLSVFAATMLLIFSSTLLYVVEGRLQPDAFGSIPRAMWWSVATLTTVGYGDVYPITIVGRIFGSITAIAGVVMVAMPAGILAAAFSDAMQSHKEELTGTLDVPYDEK
jgi:voltage-gated potassium channel